MEKFGIFELLDALSALTNLPSTHQEEDKRVEIERTTPPPPQNKNAAVSSFLQRHDALSHKIDGNLK